MPVSVGDGVLDNGILRARGCENWQPAGACSARKIREPDRHNSSEAGNEYLYVEGKDFDEIRRNQSRQY
jgi:hypothetical protein